jgi:hypothetical protein
MNDNNKNPRRWIRFAVKQEEYNKIHNFFSETNCRKLSDYLRRVLLQKPVVIIYRNQTAEDSLATMNQLKKDLNAALRNLDAGNESSKQILKTRFEETCLRMSQIYELWSRE